MTIAAHSHRSFGAFLFDMDGTILSSIAATERVWSNWARGYGLNLATFLPTIHGVRAVDTVRRLNLEGVDPQVEADVLLRAELEDVDGIVPIAGAARFLASLPTDRWAVVTSAPRELAKRRLAAAGLQLPAVIVAAEDVTQGKPSPDCFLLGAQLLGQEPEDCLVFEDAAAGIAAGEAASMSIVVVTATHPHSPETRHPTLHTYDTVIVETGKDGNLLILDRNAAPAQMEI